MKGITNDKQAALQSSQNCRGEFQFPPKKNFDEDYYGYISTEISVKCFTSHTQNKLLSFFFFLSVSFMESNLHLIQT